MLMIGLVRYGWGRLESRANLHAEHARRRLHQESVVEPERSGARPVHVRIDAVTIVPPPHILSGERERCGARAKLTRETRWHVPRHRQLAKPDVVTLVEEVED